MSGARHLDGTRKPSAAGRTRACSTPPSRSSSGPGRASADINAIVEAAGVSRSTFYFHFPTKEHVLLELIRLDEDHLAEELSRFLDTPHDLPAVLDTLVSLVLALEKQWGAGLFRDVTGMLFSSSRPDEQWTRHPTFVLLAAEINCAPAIAASCTPTSTPITAPRSS